MGRALTRVRPCACALLVGLALVALVSRAHGDDAGTAVDPQASLVAEARALHQLMEGMLAPSVDARSLFDVSIDDEGAVEIERVRLRALLAAMTEAAAPKRVRETLGGRMDAGMADARESAGVVARLDLDRARLAFYDLPLERRRALVREHDALRASLRPAKSDAERLAEGTNAERQRALEAAKSARSEAERLVAEELARLIDLSQKAATFEKRFAGEHRELLGRVDEVIGWQRRAREAKRSAKADADATYDALRKTLRVRRDDLDVALERLAASRSALPDPGPDPLVRIPKDAGLDKVRARRTALAEELRRARDAELTLEDERAAVLLDETNVLNAERLGLLRYLSAEKRAGITGFTAAGWDQARSEIRQLLLIVRYRRLSAQRWLPAASSRADVSWVRVFGASAPWLVLVCFYVWWRRRATLLLEAVEQRMVEQDRRERRTTPSGLLHVARFARTIERPLTQLAFFGIGIWLLPASVRSLLEVQLLEVIVGWSMAGALVVTCVLALAAVGRHGARPGEVATDALRVQSLRLVGRVVVVFALVLVVSARLVGEGTVYTWVGRACWLSAVVVFFVLVRWWRDVVFTRIAAMRRKGAWHGWVLANRAGWKSFVAATVGATYLFVAWVIRVVRARVAHFTLTRRADAYLFKRELDRLASDQRTLHLRPLRDELRAALGPDVTGDVWMDEPPGDVLREIARRLDEGRGGVIALVGPRGAGKTSILRHLRAHAPTGVSLICASDTSAAAVAAAVADYPGDGAGVLHTLDDADASIKPVLFGLRMFDEILALARERGRGQPRALWVLALDSVIWPYLRRVRDDRPLFDKVLVLPPWTDEQIGSLLAQRSSAAGIDPTFDSLLDKQHALDEIALAEALAEKRAGYVRVIWDYARGNPAIALEVWRSSLVEDDRGSVHARPLSIPSAAVLEHLPDSALFILRAVLQMAPASVADVMQATRLAEEEVHNALRFGQRHGYLVEEDGRVRVTWAWLRLILVLLERRHLLVQP